MQLIARTVLVLLSAVSAFVGQAVAVPMKRQDVVPAHGTIVAPAASAAIAPGAVFSFDFDSDNYCESGYEPITVYLMDNEPDTSLLSSDGSFPQSAYLYEFGQWLIPNFGLPPQQNPTPPPSNLTMPDLSQDATDPAVYVNSTLYLVIVETYLDCPGNVAEEFGISSQPIVYNATSA